MLVNNRFQNWMLVLNTYLLSSVGALGRSQGYSDCPEGIYPKGQSDFPRESFTDFPRAFPQFVRHWNNRTSVWLRVCLRKFLRDCLSYQGSDFSSETAWRNWLAGKQENVPHIGYIKFFHIAVQ